jgi:hypothetical protein
LGTKQQDFALFHSFPLDRFFSVDYIAASDSGDGNATNGRPAHLGKPKRRVTHLAGFHRDIEEAPFHPCRRRSQPVGETSRKIASAQVACGDAHGKAFLFFDGYEFLALKSSRVERRPAENRATAYSRHSGVKYKGSLCAGEPNCAEEINVTNEDDSER